MFATVVLVSSSHRSPKIVCELRSRRRRRQRQQVSDGVSELGREAVARAAEKVRRSDLVPPHPMHPPNIIIFPFTTDAECSSLGEGSDPLVEKGLSCALRKQEAYFRETGVQYGGKGRARECRKGEGRECSKGEVGKEGRRREGRRRKGEKGEKEGRGRKGSRTTPLRWGRTSRAHSAVPAPVDRASSLQCRTFTLRVRA